MKLSRFLVLFIIASMLLSACSFTWDSSSGISLTWGDAPAEDVNSDDGGLPSLAEYHPVGADDERPDISRVGVSIWGVPKDTTPVRWAGTVQPKNTCTLNSANWMLADPGVIGADSEREAAANPSAVWHGGAQVDNLMENYTATYTLPEEGYMKVTFPQANIVVSNAQGDSFRLEFEARENTNYTLLMRGNYDMPGDGNAPVAFVTSHPGRVKVMRYPIPVGHGGFFSQVHLEEDIMSGHSYDNCGIQGCELSIVVLLDINDGSYGIYRHTTEFGWVLLHTNVNAP